MLVRIDRELVDAIRGVEPSSSTATGRPLRTWDPSSKTLIEHNSTSRDEGQRLASAADSAPDWIVDPVMDGYEIFSVEEEVFFSMPTELVAYVNVLNR